MSEGGRVTDWRGELKKHAMCVGFARPGRNLRWGAVKEGSDRVVDKGVDMEDA